MWTVPAELSNLFVPRHRRSDHTAAFAHVHALDYAVQLYGHVIHGALAYVGGGEVAVSPAMKRDGTFEDRYGIVGFFSMRPASPLAVMAVLSHDT